MLYFDIDGVARRLDLAAYGYEVDVWGAKNKIGLTLLDIVSMDPSICARAPASEYIGLINSLPIVRFLSNQPLLWQEFTHQWLREHVNVPYIAHFTAHKLNRLEPNDHLIDDYPFFEDYSQIILVDRPYNRQVDCEIRVCNEKELREVLECTN